MHYDWPVVNLSFRLKGNSKCTCTSLFIESVGGSGQGSWHCLGLDCISDTGKLSQEL